jgi:hypothetical protein
MTTDVQFWKSAECGFDSLIDTIVRAYGPAHARRILLRAARMLTKRARAISSPALS